MRFAVFAVFASAILLAGPAFPETIDCIAESDHAATAKVAAAQREDMLEETVLQKRKQAREEDLAQAKARMTERLIRTGASPPPAGAPRITQ